MPTDERKAEIHTAAEKLFGERGYDKVTMSDVAAAVGMSKKTLYRLFADKEALLKSLVRSSDIWPDGVFAVDAGDRVDELRLRLRVIANHVLSERHINLSRLAISESMGIKGLAQTFLEMGIGKSRDSLIESISKIERRRFVIDLPPHLLADMLYGATCGLHLMSALLTRAKPNIKTVYATIDETIGKTFVFNPAAAPTATSRRDSERSEKKPRARLARTPAGPA
jgi:AcrR family transcriptional regulator